MIGREVRIGGGHLSASVNKKVHSDRQHTDVLTQESL